MRKTRILQVGEFSGLNTGYACIGRNFLHKLYNSGKYEVAELAGYYREGDSAFAETRRQFPWKIYGNIPQNEHEEQIYRSNPINEFGKWKFDYVCLDFQPDIVITYRDFWMDAFIQQSPFRRLFKLVMMPTVDAECQHDEWIDFYKNSDAILAYTKFGYDVLADEGGGLIPLRGVTTPAVDISTYKPVADKRRHKASLGLDPDSLIVGMVARNQRRKLYPEFGEAFSAFLRKAEFLDTNNVYLYWHTAHPDLGWDIPKYIKNLGLSRKILMTYYCNNPACNVWFTSLYQDVATMCPRCRQWSATLSGSQKGIDNNGMAAVYNSMDLYVQFVTNEGLGIPTMEAAACGVPICGTYYSGTQDLIDNLGGHPIAPRTYYVEAETTRKLCYPSVDELVDYIYKFAALPESVRLRMSMNTHRKTVEYYGGWDGFAQRWMEVFDGFDVGKANQWATTPMDIVNVDGIATPDINRMSHEQFLGWALSDVLHRPEWINSYTGLKMLRDLSWGRTVVNNLGFFANEASHLGAKISYDSLDRGKLLNNIKDMRRLYNQAEIARKQLIEQGKIV